MCVHTTFKGFSQLLHLPIHCIDVSQMLYVCIYQYTHMDKYMHSTYYMSMNHTIQVSTKPRFLGCVQYEQGMRLVCKIILKQSFIEPVLSCWCLVYIWMLLPYKRTVRCGECRTICRSFFERNHCEFPSQTTTQYSLTHGDDWGPPHDLGNLQYIPLYSHIVGYIPHLNLLQLLELCDGRVTWLARPKTRTCCGRTALPCVAAPKSVRAIFPIYSH